MSSQNDEKRIPISKYADGLYYIGTKASPCWLIESSDGVILLDTAMPDDFDCISDNMKDLGYEISDVRHIIHSHGHIDHIGCTRRIVSLSGAKTYIGKGDEDTVRGKNELQWTNEFGMKFEGAFEPDVIINDGDVIEIGDRSFYFLSTPGHTAGVVSIFFDVTDKGRVYRAGMFGGAGFNSLSVKYIEKYSLPRSLRDDFLNGLLRLMKESVDIHMGNHLGNNDHLKRAAKLSDTFNPFIDPTSFPNFIKSKYDSARELFERDPFLS